MVIGRLEVCGTYFSLIFIYRWNGKIRQIIINIREGQASLINIIEENVIKYEPRFLAFYKKYA